MYIHQDNTTQTKIRKETSARFHQCSQMGPLRKIQLSTNELEATLPPSQKTTSSTSSIVSGRHTKCSCCHNKWIAMNFTCKQLSNSNLVHHPIPIVNHYFQHDKTPFNKHDKTHSKMMHYIQLQHSQCLLTNIY